MLSKSLAFCTEINEMFNNEKEICPVIIQYNNVFNTKATSP